MNRLCLSRNFISLKSLAIGIIASTSGLMLVPSSVFAAKLIFPDQTCFIGTVSELPGSVDCVDKEFSNFDFNIVEDPGGNDLVDIGIAAGEFFLDYEPSTNPVPAARNGTISYDIAILPEFTENFFHTVEIDSDVIGIGSYEITKEFETDNGIIGSIESINGDIDSASIDGAKSVSITDTLNSNGDELVSFDNAFTQRTTGVPEPTTLLGLLTISALGLGLKPKKQS